MSDDFEYMKPEDFMCPADIETLSPAYSGPISPTSAARIANQWLQDNTEVGYVRLDVDNINYGVITDHKTPKDTHTIRYFKPQPIEPEKVECDHRLTPRDIATMLGHQIHDWQMGRFCPLCDSLKGGE